MTVYELFTMLGGIGLFLYGMNIMSLGLKNACGEKLKTILEHATKNKYISVVVGIIVTLLIQSSSATDVMVIGFVHSGLMTLAQAIGVIMGANIGTTITAQITAFHIGAYAPAILFLGTVMYLFLGKPFLKHIGTVIMGFGMLFEGVELMKSAITPLSTSPAFIGLISGLSNPVLTMLFGMVFTALLQSSSSATVIFQAFAMEGIINYHVAAYLCIGSSIGSVAPNILASLTSNRNGKRTALLNLIFNLIRAAALMSILAFFPGIFDMIQSLSPGNIGRQIANTHTIFAIFSVLLMLPFTSLIVKLTYIFLPLKAEETSIDEDRKLLFIQNPGAIPPATALQQAHKEITRMGKIALDNLRLSITSFFEKTEDKYEIINETEETVNYLEQAILSKLIELRTKDMHPNDLNLISHMTLTISDLERLSDHATNINSYARQIHSENTKLSAEAMKGLRTMANATLEIIELALYIWETKDFSRYSEVEALESSVDSMQEKLIQNHIERFLNSHCEPRAAVLFCDMVTDLERCADHAVNIAASLKAIE